MDRDGLWSQVLFNRTPRAYDYDVCPFADDQYHNLRLASQTTRLRAPDACPRAAPATRLTLTPGDCLARCAAARTVTSQW